MATLSITNTFSAATTAVAGEVNTNFTDIQTYINNRNDGTNAWEACDITSTSSATPHTISSNQVTTSVVINNTASDGDPLVAFQLSGTAQFTMGVDDGDSDIFKIGTTAIGTNTRLSISSSIVVFNEPGNDIDFRVEGDAEASLIFVDAGNDRVGIATAAPSDPLHVTGIVRIMESGDTTNYTRIQSSTDTTFIDSFGTAASSGAIRLRTNDAARDALQVDALGNIGISTTTFGTNADGVLGILNAGVVPASSPANMIQIYSKDSSDGSTNATLAIRTEQAPESTGTFTQTHRLQIWVNETEYFLPLDAV